MRKISKIERKIPQIPSRKKVAAYARVSVETERLHHSLSAQVSYYSELIQKHPGWEYVGVYADNGISGTSTAARAEFNRMIADCEAGKIDIILTKSISRFARNTVDLLNTVRHLKDLGIAVQFEKENINSLSDDGELMLTLLASFAQEESISISNNVKWAARKRMEQGIPNGHFQVFGYEWKGDQLVIVPEEAVIVKRIYQNFLDGKSRLETEREFESEGITTRLGCRWVDSNIKVVLTNITYTGNLLLQKEFIEDPIGKKRRKNKGELPQYFVENTHEAIIDMETFQYVQSEIARRKELGALANKSLNITFFTGKIKCPHCNQSYMHNKRKPRTKNAKYLEYWTCGTKKKSLGRCPVPGSINHESLKKACCRVLNIDEFDEDLFLEKIDHIEVPEGYTLDFFMTDGTILREAAPNTGHRDCWTDEYKARASKERRRQIVKVKGSNCFTSKIRCAECGNNYRRQTRKRSTGEKYYIYACATTNTCSNNSIHEDVLHELTAKALGMEQISEDAFEAQIDYISIAPGGNITFHFYDGHETSMTYSIKKKMPAWTDERREKQTAAIRASYTPERREKMSQTMKKIRSEKYWASTKRK